MIDARQRRNVANQLVEERRLEQVRFLGYQRLDREDDLLRGGRVGAEQPPVDEAAIAKVRIVRILRGEAQHVLNERLRVGGPFQKQLHDRRQQLQLHLRVLVLEPLEEAVEQLVGVVDPLGVLADDPDHGGARFGFVQRVEVFAQRAYDALVLVRVLPEDVLDDDDRFLDDVVHLGLDQVEQGRDAALGGRLDFDRAAADRADGLSDEVDIDFGCVLLQLAQHLGDVGLRGEPDHDVELLELHVDRVVVLDEKDLKRIVPIQNSDT